VVGNAGEIPLPAEVGDLIHPDPDQPVKPAVVEAIGDDALDDLPDGVPPDPQQASDRGLAICCASYATTSSRSRV
jgi:hypothetical protein